MAGDTGPADETSLAVENGRIVALGSEGPSRETVDAGNRIVMPGFIDCHTHALYAGDRLADHNRKLDGVSYEEIARSGGGIMSTVKAVRAASTSQLIRETLPRLQALQSEGVTTIEIKSGYGLEHKTELKMLRAIRAISDHIKMNVSATFLGAHSVPAGIDKYDYLKAVMDKMLPDIVRDRLAESVDIFVERIAFDLDDLTSLFKTADAAGLQLRAHTEQLSHLGGTGLAASLGAISCDHLEYADDRDVASMAAAGTVAVLLPGAYYFLRETRVPPVELLRKHDVSIAIATDLNPGSSPLASLLTVMHMGALLFGLTAEEVLLGVTLNAARALGKQSKVGSLEPGKQADFSLWSLPSPDFLVYQLGGLKPDAVYHHGQKI